MGYTYLWEFTVTPEHAAEFAQVYGPAGPWVALFKQSAGYLGTLLLRDQANPQRFITVDRWRSAADYQAFRAASAAAYCDLDERCQSLTEHERSLGSYDE